MTESRVESTNLKKWLLSLVEDMSEDELMKIKDAVEDVALAPDGEDPFYSEENQRWLEESVAQLKGNKAQEAEQDA